MRYASAATAVADEEERCAPGEERVDSPPRELPPSPRDADSPPPRPVVLDGDDAAPPRPRPRPPRGDLIAIRSKSTTSTSAAALSAGAGAAGEVEAEEGNTSALDESGIFADADAEDDDVFPPLPPFFLPLLPLLLLVDLGRSRAATDFAAAAVAEEASCSSIMLAHDSPFSSLDCSCSFPCCCCFSGCCESCGTAGAEASSTPPPLSTLPMNPSWSAAEAEADPGAEVGGGVVEGVEMASVIVSCRIRYGVTGGKWSWCARVCLSIRARFVLSFQLGMRMNR